MAKYFLTNYVTLPEEIKKDIGMIKYINFGILAFLFMVTVKKGEQVLQLKVSQNIDGDSLELMSTSIEKIEKKAIAIIHKEETVIEEIPEYAHEKINELAKTFESEIRQEATSASDLQLKNMKKNRSISSITIHTQHPLQNEELSSLLLYVFETLQVFGEDQAYIDVERTKLGVVSAIHIKGIQHMNQEQLKIFINRITKETGVHVYKS